MIQKIVSFIVILIQLSAINVPMVAAMDQSQEHGNHTAQASSAPPQHHRQAITQKQTADHEQARHHQHSADHQPTANHHDLTATSDTAAPCDDTARCENCKDNLCGSLCHCPAAAAISSSIIDIPSVHFALAPACKTSVPALCKHPRYRPPIA